MRDDQLVALIAAMMYVADFRLRAKLTDKRLDRYIDDATRLVEFALNWEPTEPVKGERNGQR